MKKPVKKLILALLLFLVLAGFLTFILWIYPALSGLMPTAAHLVVDTGSVELKSGARWVKVSDSDLVAGDIVRTLAESEATILFFETSFIKLFPDTELEIKELDKKEAKVTLKQNSGKSWSEVIRQPEAEGSFALLADFLGINSYQIEVPNAVASVRGTSFGIDLTEEESRLAVLEGTVNLKTEEEEEDIQEKEEARLLKKLIKKKLLEEDAFIIKAKEIKEKGLQLRKERLKKKYARLLRLIKERYQFSDEQIDQGLEDYLQGKIKLKDFDPEAVKQLKKDLNNNKNNNGIKKEVARK